MNPPLRRAAAIAALGLSACVVHAPEPVYPTTTSASIADTYVCAIRVVNDAQYSIVTADRASGVFRAERNQTGGLYVDELSLSVYPDTLGHTELRIVADVQGDCEKFPASREGRAAREAEVRACANSRIRN